MITRITDTSNKKESKGKKQFQNQHWNDVENEETVDEETTVSEAEDEETTVSEVEDEEVSADNIITIDTRSKKPYIVTAVIILLVIASIGAYFYLNRTFTSFVTDTKKNRADETEMEYISFQGGFIKYNVDGITFEDRDGNIIWTEAITMTNPKVVIRGEYVAVTDIGDNSYALYNATKKIGNYPTDYPITDIQLAEQGVVAVVLEDEKTNYIVAFNTSGDKCVEIKTTINKNGYPLAIALSQDGTKLVASYITIEGTDVENALTFYNFSDVGKNEVDRQVGYKKFDNELFPRMEFVSNDTLCVFGDSRIMIYAMKQKPTEKANIEIKGDAKSIFYNEEYIGYVSKKQSKAVKDGEESHQELAADADEDATKYTLHAYNLSGKNMMEEEVDFPFYKVHATADEIVLVSDVQCKIYKYNGQVKYEGEFENGILDFFPTTRHNRYVVVTADELRMVHLK